MAKLTLTGLGPVDGTYEFDSSRYTMRDLHTIKRISGVRAAELSDALASADTDVYVALAAIALQRNGVTGAEDVLWNADIGQIAFDFGDGEDESPPDVTPEGPKPSSGDDSSGFSGSRENPPSPTGGHPSDTSAISDQEISAI